MKIQWKIVCFTVKWIFFFHVSQNSTGALTFSQKKKTGAQTTTTNHPPKLHIGKKKQPPKHHQPFKKQPPTTIDHSNDNHRQPKIQIGNQKKKKKNRLKKPAKRQPPSTKKNLYELRSKTQETKNIIWKSNPSRGKMGG